MAKAAKGKKKLCFRYRPDWRSGERCTPARSLVACWNKPETKLLIDAVKKLRGRVLSLRIRRQQLTSVMRLSEHYIREEPPRGREVHLASGQVPQAQSVLSIGHRRDRNPQTTKAPNSAHGALVYDLF